MEDLTLVAVVIVALFFDFTNGFHDTANSIATSVSTRALSPRAAVLIAAIMNFVGAFVSLKVAATIAKGIVNPEAITLSVVLAGLVGAITWNLITWFLGLPSSSSHALIGGIAGAAIAADGLDVVYWSGIWEKVVKPGILSPVLGFAIAFAMMIAIIWVVRRRSPSKVNRVFRRAQIFSGSFVAFTHGTNDAQKTMGIIALALISTGHLNAEEFDVPFWVIVSLGHGDGARHLRGRLADHPARWERGSRRSTRRRDSLRRPPAPGSSGRPRTSGFPGLDDADDLGLRRGRRGEQGLLRRPLGDRGEHRLRLDPHAPRGRARGRVDGGRHAAARGRPDRLPPRRAIAADGVPRASVRDAPAPARARLAHADTDSLTPR